MSDPMDQQKDQREQLRKKVKLLEEEIVQRTRNFMQSSRLRHKHSLKPNDKKCIQMGIQTDPAMIIHQLNNHSANESEWNQQLVNELRQFQQTIRQNFADLIEIDNQRTQQKPKQKESTKFSQSLKTINNSVLQMISFLLQIIKYYKLTPQNSNPIPSKLTFKNIYIEALQILSKQLNEYPQTTTKQIEELQTKLQKYSNKLRQTEVRCQFITKALNQSEQANYQLRLQIQDLENRCRDSFGQLLDSKRKIQEFQVDNGKMKLKIQQMEVMKKEYLRAYSKIKQQKQSLHIKLLDLQQQLQNKIRNEKYFNINNANNYEIQEASGSGSRLKTIEQHMMQDERREQIIRRTQCQNSLSAIKQIIEHGLMQTNRSTSQKWIKSALLKLENYEQNQMEQVQKNIKSQTIIETNIHDNYKCILNNIVKNINTGKDLIQSQFNIVMDRIVGMRKGEVGEGWGEKQEVKGVRQESGVEEDNGFDSSLNSSKSVDLEPKVYELVSKLNESYVKYEQVKKKYDQLLQQRQQPQPNPTRSQIPPKLQQSFNKVLNKIIDYQQKIKIKTLNTKYNEQFFDKLSHKIFEIVCNLPTISNQQMFFIPTNQEELQDALNLIYQFSLEFDQIQEARFKEFKNQAFGLARVLEDIAVAKEVSPEMVIKSMNDNLPEESMMSGDYVKTLIKKLSQEQPDKKPKSSKSIQIQQKQKDP